MKSRAGCRRNGAGQSSGLKRIADLPVLQHLLAGGESLDWMKSDPDIKDFIADDPMLRIQAARDAGHTIMLNSWQKSGSMLAGWMAQWRRVCPLSSSPDRGLRSLEKLLHQQLQVQAQQQTVAQHADYEQLLDKLRVIFRRHAFQPAAVIAYLAMVAVDLHRIRSHLMQRMYFSIERDIAQGLPE